MPRMDGYRLGREIRKSVNALPIVLYTTTYSSASDRQLAEAVGADFFQLKPAPKALGEATLLRQVLINLLGNAIKYTRARDPAVIEVGSRKGRQHEVVVFVRDNGIGFDMQRGHKLFGAFQRLHGTASSKVQA